jgi:MtN3 and saliva related transmembrane protein
VSNWINEIGLLAAVLTTCSFAPQLVKIWRTRSARDVSFGMFLLFTLGVALWLVYGILRQDLVIIVANTVTFILALTILILKLRFDGWR